ncbi:hypothetical protein [Aliivibrio fischeri]|uniref:hypothetical protein n=1 Tax=Aliivibrio fischeri TaxID=668 RepID=UPI0012D85717|nr:hypothetical protein [Aliivibrio fischeri]MUJ20360.1 hypothetical protein [Aliivibrio fischeri]
MSILKEITNLLVSAHLDEAIVRIVMKGGEPQVIVQFSVNSSTTNNVTDKEKALRSALCLPLICNGNESELNIIDALKSLSEPLGEVVQGITSLDVGTAITKQANSAALEATATKKPKNKKVESKNKKVVATSAIVPEKKPQEVKPQAQEPITRIEELNMDSLFSSDSSFLIK